MDATAKYYVVVTFGDPATRTGGVMRDADRARKLAHAAKGTGTCSSARVYECDTRELARTADISRVRAGERIVATA